MSADRADEENLKTTSFTKGEWIENEPIALAMDYDLVAETFATAGRRRAAGHDHPADANGVGLRDRRSRQCVDGKT